MSAGIRRYTMSERVGHWVASWVYVYPLLTGLSFYSPHLSWLATVLGGGPTSRFWHPVVGVVFVGFLLWMLNVWGADMKITAADLEWKKAMPRYIRNEDENLPPIGRFNYGQKLFYWVMLFAGVLLLLSGSVLWFPEIFARKAHALLLLAIFVHVSAALISIGAFIIHVYMGTAMVRGGFTSIVRGEVSPAWAKMHHRLWYEREIGESRPKS
jgi:formate dehydrogenase subunit gamma